jgi:hypothetical protein
MSSNITGKSCNSDLDESSVWLATVIEHLEKRQHTYTISQYKSQSVIESSIAMPNGDCRMLIRIKGIHATFGMYVYAPMRIPESRHPEWLDILARGNFSWDYAKMELNPETGEVRCGLALYLQDSGVSLAMLEHLEYKLTEYLNALLPALQDVANLDGSASNPPA